MKWNSMRCQEVRNGEIIAIITTTSILVLATTAATTTNTNRTNLKTTWQGKQWAQRPKDSKITLTQESDHYVPTELSSNFFKQFNLAMKLKQEELKKQGRSSNQVNELTEGNLIQAFSVTEDQMEKAASILSRNEGTEKLGNLSAWLAKELQGWGHRWQYNGKRGIFYKHRKD